MKKGKKLFQDAVEKVAIKVAKMDANTACPCISYQPKLPKAVKKLRKS
ncbi:MAG: cyclic lactone autoinducer peptide [Lachnospiraceae bacterium]|nr:cyclic lactone autoinducer peptide [Lachnospiraceae bacterium]MDE7286514.1 cyclic lactone autoinducer peptide [Lachnospiraceae bacterium]